MTQSQPLLDFLHGLISDGVVRARFAADPASSLAAAGVVATSPQAVYEALVRIGDDQDLAQGFDRGFGDGRARGTDVLHVPPPPPPEFFGERDAHDAALHYLDNYVTSSFDDDLGPFTGSSADHATDAGAAFDEQVPGEGTDHGYSADHGADHRADHGADHGADHYAGHDQHYGSSGGDDHLGSDPGHHDGFGAGGL